MKEKNPESYLESLLMYDLEYVSIINAQGRIMDFASKDLHLSREKLEMLCMGIRLQHSMQSDFDDDLGAVNYIVTERDNLKFVSIPILSNIIFAIARKENDHKLLVDRLQTREFLNDLKTHLCQSNTLALGIDA